MAAWQEKVDDAPVYTSDESEGSSHGGDQEELLYKGVLSVKRRSSRRWTLYHAALTTILAIVTIAQSTLLYKAYYRKPWPVPEFPLSPKNFTRMIDFEFGETATELWDAVLPNSGLVAVENPERYGLASGLVTEKPNSMVYGVSVTHEYHCLQMIHSSLMGVATRDPEYMELIHAANLSVELPPGKLNHLFHCVDYIRQNIMCRADVTLESRSLANSEHIDGYYVPHQCKNWDNVMGWISENLPPEKAFHKPQSQG